MERLIKIFLTILALIGVLALWHWADEKDYFKANYRDLSASQKMIFKWYDAEGDEKLMNLYRHYSFDSLYHFPRQKATKVKLFRNTPILSVLTSKTLKPNLVGNFVQFCNDTTNFHFGETTWRINESEYFCRLYDADNNVIGKIYFCLDDCGMTSSKPFTPSMKFGGLSSKGLTQIVQLLNDKTNWE